MFKSILAFSVLALLTQSNTIYITPSKGEDLGTHTSRGDIWDGYGDLRKICSCESNGSPDKEPRQFEDNGTPLWGRIKDPETGLTVILKRDVGSCQINIKVHGDRTKELGLDVINSFQDNVTFAKMLYKEAGITPWLPSRNCWDNAATGIVGPANAI